MSKAIENLAAGNYMPELTSRERIKAHLKTRGKIKLTEADIVIMDRAERVKDILLANRTNLVEAKQLIKTEFNFTHRSEIDRAIEDATYLCGAVIKTQKDYQRLLQLADIEFWLAFAKEAKDGYLANEMMKRREKLFRLDELDVEAEQDYFSMIVIVQEFKPEEFTHTLKPGYQERIEEKKQQLLRKVGLAADIEDVPYTEE